MEVEVGYQPSAFPLSLPGSYQTAPSRFPAVFHDFCPSSKIVAGFRVKTDKASSAEQEDNRSILFKEDVFLPTCFNRCF